MMYDWLYTLTGSQILAAIIQSLLPLFAFILPFALFAVLLERKVAGHMQDRLGPMRVGYHGILQTIADILKLIQKEDIIASNIDTKFFNLSPVLVFAGSYAAFAAIPFSGAFLGSNIDLGILYIVAVTGIVVAGILMGGWSSNNKYSLLGAMRSAAQIISYEIPTLLIVVTVIMITGTMNLYTMSEWQTDHFWNWLILGGPVYGIQKILLIPLMVVSFLIIFLSTLAEVNRTPFDIPEAESELVSGYHTEYSGMKFAIFFLAEYANMFAISVIVSALFLGGFQSPVGYIGKLLNIEWLIPIEQFFWFSSKGIFFVFVQMWLRWTLPRFRVDQLMAFCWKYLIPFSFVILLIVGLITVL
ncbi:MAG: NADH-quinone oxidoreductase subunit NuoH [Ignavibacteriaceae bacterium]